MVAVLGGCFSTVPTSDLVFPEYAVIYREGAGRRVATLYRPSTGNGPFPAVVLMHTCGGIGQHIHDWAGRLTEVGYVALVVDSNGVRGVPNNCQGADAKVTVDEVAADAARALAHLRAQPWVDGERLAVMGFSFGAMAALRLSGESYQRRLADGVTGLRAVVFFYGACGTDSSSLAANQSSNNLADDIVTPTLMLLGGLDTETPPRFCTAKADRLRERGQPIAYKLYPDATHSFDSSRWGTEGRWIRHGQRGPFLYRYSAEATEDSWNEIQAFFARHLTPRPAR